MFLRTIESVREISLRAGQAFVTQYAETSIDVMLVRFCLIQPRTWVVSEGLFCRSKALTTANDCTLQPTLLEGLFDDNWRIRQSSTMLVGDLLFHFLDKDQKKENQQRRTFLPPRL